MLFAVKPPGMATIRTRLSSGSGRGRASTRCEARTLWITSAARGQRVAMILLGGVNYYSGELLDIRAITRAGHAAGAVVGWDLAHAAGNVPLSLHEWGVDWASVVHATST